MGFYLRKSISVGPLRFNLSKSGIGVSAGVKGLRFGVGPRGNYVHIGRGGLYYRATLPPLTHPRHPRVHAGFPQPGSLPDATHAPLEGIDSAVAFQIVDSSSRELLEELNRKRAINRMWPAVLIASALLLAMGVSQHWPIWLLGMIVPAGLISTYIVHTRDALEKTVVLFYEFDSDMEAAYTKLLGAAKQLASCAAAWHVEASGQVHNRKYHAGASKLVSRKATVIGTAQPPDVKTNIETIAIGVGSQTLHFFPDRVLIYDKTGVGAVSYPELRVEVSATQFIESDTVPHDAEVVGRTWKYVNKSGGPDRRFSGNHEIPLCRYEEILLSSQSGLKELIQISRCGYGAEFAQAITSLGRKLPMEGSVKVKQPATVEPKSDSTNPLFNDAVAFIRQSGRCSITDLQRRFHIKYAPAIELMSELEAKRIVGPVRADGVRDIYIEIMKPEPPAYNATIARDGEAATQFERLEAACEQLAKMWFSADQKFPIEGSGGKESSSDLNCCRAAVFTNSCHLLTAFMRYLSCIGHPAAFVYARVHYLTSAAMAAAGGSALNYSNASYSKLLEAKDVSEPLRELILNNSEKRTLSQDVQVLVQMLDVSTVLISSAPIERRADNEGVIREYIDSLSALCRHLVVIDEEISEDEQKAMDKIVLALGKFQRKTATG